MNPFRLAAAVLLGSACSVAFGDPTEFKIDTVHSQIFFSASHDGYTNPSGRMHVKAGTFVFDPDDWNKSRVDATVDIASLDMGDEPWNRKLLNAYFDVGTYPTAHFVSISVEKTGERSGVIHGNLTLLEKTRPIDLQVKFNRVAVNGYTLRFVAGFSADAAFKRSLFGMSRELKSVGDDVTVHMEIEGVRERSDATNSEAAAKE